MMWIAGVLAATLVLVPSPVDPPVPDRSESLLIDDFAEQNSTSALGTMWRCFTDRVMGGVSNASHTVESKDGVSFLRLEGAVSLENNGGFAQVALDLDRRGQAISAAEYTGVRLTVRGNGESYYVHFKNGQTPQHWNYFEASFDTTDEWREVEIPFADFKPERGQREMDVTTLKRVAVVAAHSAHAVDVCVSKIEFYR